MDTPEVKPELMLAGEVAKRIPHSPNHIRRLENAGQFPKRIRLGANRVCWVRAEVEQWINDRMEAR